MRNRAKCKLCQSIIESFTLYDHVSCKCGEISVSGGNMELYTSAKDYANFIRVDDLGNEIAVKVVEEINITPKEDVKKPNKQELLGILDEMVKNIEGLPQNAMTTPINHYDFCSLLILLSSILRAD